MRATTAPRSPTLSFSAAPRLSAQPSFTFPEHDPTSTLIIYGQTLTLQTNREDIQICQSLNKSILLSIGGATYTEGGFDSAEDAQTWASTIWAMFGPAPPGWDESDTDVLRPFGNATVDGFDMDLEASSAHMPEFAGALRANMDGSDAGQAGRKFLLSAAPQCPFPDAAMGEMLDAGGFDYVGVQFYNNYCAASAYQSGDQEPGQFNFETWYVYLSHAP